ncbi:hypothetical protein GFY24_30705 [Nocardia sp. SYP-A9097]|nr:hypothetical protein [Nocardia sp. SYP-A9097]
MKSIDLQRSELYMRPSVRTVALSLATPVAAIALSGIATGTASAAPSCQGSMNAGFAYNGLCKDGEGMYRLEIDCVGYNTNPLAIGPYTIRQDFPIGQAGTVACIGPGWSSAGWGVGGRVLPL